MMLIDIYLFSLLLSVSAAGNNAYIVEMIPLLALAKLHDSGSSKLPTREKRVYAFSTILMGKAAISAIGTQPYVPRYALLRIMCIIYGPTSVQYLIIMRSIQGFLQSAVVHTCMYFKGDLMGETTLLGYLELIRYMRQLGIPFALVDRRRSS